MKEKLTPRDLLAFLFGSRDAIERFGQCPATPLVGLLFVLSAGLAREYDRADLLHEPWHLLLPFAASLGTSFILYCWLSLAAWRTESTSPWRSFLAGYWQFLGWYWLTAPLAWLYAIPYERFCSPLAATQANYATLALVALWRVLLIIRVAVVAYRLTATRATFFVLAFADVVAFIAVNVAPKPVFDVMAGVRLADDESFVISAWLLITFGSFWLGIGLLLICLVLLGGNAPPSGETPQSAPLRLGAGLWTLSAIGLLAWLPILPSTQPPEQRRWQADRLMRDGKIEEALAYLSQFEPEQFPPHFNPPPRLAYHELEPDLATVLVAAQRPEVAAWVRTFYQDKWELQISPYGFYRSRFARRRFTDVQLADLLTLIENRPDGPDTAADIVQYSLTEYHPDPPLPEQRQALVDRFKELAERVKEKMPEP